MIRLLIVIFSAACSMIAMDSRVCAGCHREIYERYRRTPMAQSSGVVDQVTPGSFRTPTGQEFRISGNSLSFSFDGQEIRRSLNYYLGAGSTGRSYLTSVDGFLFQAPVSYYASNKAWDLSPGYVD